MLEKTIQELINEISSSSPTPGGGSVSALIGAFGTALSIMVTNLTIGKKKYESVQEEINKLKIELDGNIPKFYELYKKDSDAFDEVMNAFKLPKGTENEIRDRNNAIEQSTIKATEVPIELIELCLSNLELARRIAVIGNQNSLSDAGVSIILLKASAEGAFLNVLINTKSLNDKMIAKNLILKAAEKIEQIEKIYNESITIIKKNLE